MIDNFVWYEKWLKLKLFENPITLSSHFVLWSYYYGLTNITANYLKNTALEITYSMA